MKLFSISKDGGSESTVTAYWLIEIKNLFSIVFLKFDGKSRPAFHNHAFNAVSWILSGKLIELSFYGEKQELTPSIFPVSTYRETYHMVDSVGITWVLSFRGPWARKWKEYLVNENRERTLTNGRIEV